MQPKVFKTSECIMTAVLPEDKLVEFDNFVENLKNVTEQDIWWNYVKGKAVVWYIGDWKKIRKAFSLISPEKLGFEIKWIHQAGSPEFKSANLIKKIPDRKSDAGIDDYISKTKALVAANDWERSELWSKHSPESEERKAVEFAKKHGVGYGYVGRVKTWDSRSMGSIFTIGYIGERPVCVHVSWDVINGHYIGFYSGSSQVVDHEMIKEWIKETFPQCNRYGGTSNLNNWHNLDIWK